MNTDKSTLMLQANELPGNFSSGTSQLIKYKNVYSKNTIYWNQNEHAHGMSKYLFYYLK